MRQMLAHGYEGVGIGPILATVNVPKGSFYHFFKSKDEYVVAILDAYEEKYRPMREALFSDASRSPLSRLNGYFEALEQELLALHPSGGCLYGVLAQTITARNADIRAHLAASFERWQAHIQSLLAEAQATSEIDDDVDVAEIAAALLDAYEGALIRMKASDDVSAFRRFRTVILPRLVGAPKAA